MGTQHDAMTSDARMQELASSGASAPSACGARQAWRSTIGLCAAMSVGALSLLLWSKLKLVTNVPRTAYAVPEERVPDDKSNHQERSSTREAAPEAPSSPR